MKSCAKNVLLRAVPLVVVERLLAPALLASSNALVKASCRLVLNDVCFITDIRG